MGCQEADFRRKSAIFVRSIEDPELDFCLHQGLLYGVSSYPANVIEPRGRQDPKFETRIATESGMEVA